MSLLPRRCISCLLILSVFTAALPASGPIPSIAAPPSPARYSTAALCGPSLFFSRAPALRKWTVFRQAASWCRGDPALQALRKPYRGRLGQCFVLMTGDAAVSLGIPFLGQALYDAASRGSGLPGSFRTMLGVSCLLLIIEGLDPLRRYVQFRLAQVSSGFVADVRSFLLQRRGPAQPGLIYFHAPSFAIRNIEMPLKLPLIAAQAMVSGWLLWQRDPVIFEVACLTATLLVGWSHWRRRPLEEANKQLRQAEADTLEAIEKIAPQSSDPWALAQVHFERVREMEIQQVRQGLWYDGVVDRISTVILMTGVMLWGAWHQYWFGKPSTGQILTLLALAWNVQFKIATFLALARRRLEAESASFLLPPRGCSTSA